MPSPHGSPELIRSTGECHAEEHETHVASVNVEIDGSWLRRMAEFSAPLDQPVEFADDDIVSSGMQIHRELERNAGGSALAIEALAWEILAAAARPSARLVDARAPRWLRDARDLLDSHIGEPTSLRTIAQNAGVHPSTSLRRSAAFSAARSANTRAAAASSMRAALSATSNVHSTMWRPRRDSPIKAT